MGIGMQELIIILAILVLLFGARKLPQLGGAIGESIKNFKKGIKDETSSAKELSEETGTNKGSDSKKEV